MIISASRRTDIPAFYHKWFINRLRAGFLLTRNPFNYNQVSRVSLKPSDVDAIVFWTRNPTKMIPFLPEIDEIGHKYYFQYTITGYPKTIEKSVPNPYRSIKTFCDLSDSIGSDKIVWRYDPILLSNQVDINEHKRLFHKIASLVKGKTKKVVISFSDFYKKTERNLNSIENLIYSDITKQHDELYELCSYMSSIANDCEMEIESCSENIDLSSFGIKHGKCIDDKILRDVFGLSISEEKDKGQREECGCIKSIDIGMYNTCLHECSYCYATYNKKVVINNKKKHSETSPFLLGLADDVPSELLTEDTQESLF